MQFLLLGLAVLLTLYLLARAFASAAPRLLATLVKWGLGAALLVAVALLVASGRTGALLGLALFLWPLLRRWRAALWTSRAASGAPTGAASEVSTAWLRMRLDHDSGEMDGEVLAGALRGSRLSALTMKELEALLAEAAAADPPSVPLLESFLDRHHPGWRDAGGTAEDAPPTPPRSGLSVEEAYEVLGLAPGAGEEEIRQAHRRLMMRNHPDQGGSTYLAARINQAKDILLGRKSAGS